MKLNQGQARSFSCSFYYGFLCRFNETASPFRRFHWAETG